MAALSAQYPVRDYLTVSPPSGGTAALVRYTSTTGPAGPFSTFTHPGFATNLPIERLEVEDRASGTVFGLVFDPSVQRSRILRARSPFTPLPGLAPGGLYQSSGRVLDFKTTQSGGANALLIVETVGSGLQLLRTGFPVQTAFLPGTVGAVTEDVAAGIIYVICNDTNGQLIGLAFNNALQQLAMAPLAQVLPATPVDAAFTTRSPVPGVGRLFVTADQPGFGRVLHGFSVSVVGSQLVSSLVFTSGVTGNRSISVDDAGFLSYDWSGVPPAVYAVESLDPATAGSTTLFSSQTPIDAFTWTGRSALASQNDPIVDHTQLRFQPLLLPGTAMGFNVFRSAPMVAAELRLSATLLPTPLQLSPTALQFIDLTGSIGLPIATPIPNTFQFAVPLNLSLHGTMWYAQIFGFDAQFQLYSSSLAAATAGLRPID